MIFIRAASVRIVRLLFQRQSSLEKNINCICRYILFCSRCVLFDVIVLLLVGCFRLASTSQPLPVTTGLFVFRTSSFPLLQLFLSFPLRFVCLLLGIVHCFLLLQAVLPLGVTIPAASSLSFGLFCSTRFLFFLCIVLLCVFCLLFADFLSCARVRNLSAFRLVFNSICTFYVCSALPAIAVVRPLSSVFFLSLFF